MNNCFGARGYAGIGSNLASWRYDIIVEPILTVEKFRGLFQLMYPSVVPLVKVGLKESGGIKYFVNN